MYRIIDSRGSGKTSRLMLLAKETGAAIACSNPNAMRQKAHAYGITGIDFISYGQALRKEYDYVVSNPCNKSILVDEIECFVRYALHDGNLQGYTLSNED